MNMTPEELLKPRYKVIADYPFNEWYKVGGIITDDGINAARNENGKPVFCCEWEKFPHLFRKLEWWEERAIEDFTPYLKINGRIWKIKNYEYYLGQLVFKNEIDGINETEQTASIHWHFYKDTSSPSTEEEYLNQQK